MYDKNDFLHPNPTYLDPKIHRLNVLMKTVIPMLILDIRCDKMALSYHEKIYWSVLGAGSVVFRSLKSLFKVFSYEHLVWLDQIRIWNDWEKRNMSVSLLPLESYFCSASRMVLTIINYRLPVRYRKSNCGDKIASAGKLSINFRFSLNK